jgi:hydrogenase maturation factor
VTFKENHRDLWNKIVDTIQQDMTNIYWEVPFVGGHTKVVTKMTPKKLTAGQRKKERDATKIGSPDKLI